jgi:hypothetical protein
MVPHPARFLFDFLLPQLESEQAVTQKILSSVPPGMGGYRPAPRSMSALELARHIAVVEIWFLDAIIDRNFGDVTPFPEAVKTCDDVAECYAKNFMRRMPLLEQLSSEDLATPVHFIGLRKDPAVPYLNTRDPPFDSPSWATLRVSSPDGREGGRDICGKRGRALPPQLMEAIWPQVNGPLHSDLINSQRPAPQLPEEWSSPAPDIPACRKAGM